MTDLIADAAVVLRIIAHMARDDNAEIRGDVALLAEQQAARFEAAHDVVAAKVKIGWAQGVKEGLAANRLNDRQEIRTKANVASLEALRALACRYCAAGVPVKLGQHFLSPPGHSMYSEACTAGSP